MYGYQTFRIPKQENDVTIYENVDGFIAHYGWQYIDHSNSRNNVWFNADWLIGNAFTLTSTHQHNFDTIYTDEHILKCDCGVIQTTNNHSAVSATISNNTYKHNAICACGYKFEEFHTYLYERVHYSNDLYIKYCKYCDYNTTEEHSWKNPGVCYYCDIWMSSRG